MNTAKKMQLMTLEEYEAAPEEEHIEVFEGVPYAMSAPSIKHQDILGELFFLIKDYIRKNEGNCKPFIAPCDVKMSDEPLTIVQPDLFVVCDKSKLDKNRCNGTPDFIIEIVSPGNTANDYIQKLYYYKHYGAREYWIVDPDKQIITVYDFEKEIYASRYTFDDKIKVGIYNDLYINFAPLKDLLQ